MGSLGKSWARGPGLQQWPDCLGKPSLMLLVLGNLITSSLGRNSPIGQLLAELPIRGANQDSGMESSDYTGLVLWCMLRLPTPQPELSLFWVITNHSGKIHRSSKASSKDVSDFRVRCHIFGMLLEQGTCDTCANSPVYSTRAFRCLTTRVRI